MTTRRKIISATAKSGVNYVRAIVESHNCIFHNIDLDNDIGNDAHLEFIENEEATGCLIATQIKSGRSYFRNRANYATVQSDRDHFEYWNSHSLQISMIVYDPVNQCAFWCDIAEFLRNHPERITDGPYTIRVPFFPAVQRTYVQ